MSNLKQIRLVRGYKQVDLAGLINVAQCTIANWETGRREPSIRQVRELCRVLGCTADALLGVAPQPETSISAKEGDDNG